MKKRALLIIAAIAIILVIAGIIFFAQKSSPSQSQISAEENVQTEQNPLGSEELSFEEQAWQQRIDKAVGTNDSCPPAPPRNYPEGYYTGRLIDAHFHIANIPDSTPQRDDSEEDYGDEEHPTLGRDITISKIVCLLQHEGTERVFAFFPVYKQIPQQMAQVVYDTKEAYPNEFVRFLMPPDSDDRADGFPTVDATTLESMLNIYPGLFQGYGEIGLYARGDHGGPKGSPELPPDAQRLQDIYPVVRKHNLTIYFHLGEGHEDNFARALEANPDINFIFHGDQLITYRDGIQDLSNIDKILTEHPNAYYGIDELYGDEWLLRPEVSKEEFLAHFENYTPLIEEDLETWQWFIEKHPDQVIWGTDRGWSSTWSIDVDVGLQLTDYARAFIGKLAPEVQEKFAYKNAEKLAK